MAYGDDDDNPAQGPPLNIGALVGAALRRWKLIGSVWVAVLALAYAGLKLIPSQYVSTVEILVYDPAQQLDSQVQKPVSPFIDNLGNDAMDTEISVITSQSITLRVVKQLGLDHDADFQRPDNPVAALIAWLGLDRQPITPQELRVETAEALGDRLHVTADNYVIRIEAAAQTPVLAQKIAQAVAADYLDSEQQARQDALERVQRWLGARLDEIEQQSDKTGAAIAKLKSNNQLNVLPESARQQQGHDLTTLAQLRERRTQLQWYERQLRARLGPRHAEVKGVAGQIAGLDDEIAAESARITGGNSDDYQHLQQLQRTADSERALTATYTAQLNEIAERLTQQQDANARVISPASLPRWPTKPKKRLLYAGAAVFGLGAGAALAVLLEYLATGIKTATEVEASFGHPVLGIIPTMRYRARGIENNVHYGQLVDTVRISLALAAQNPKVVLVTSALAGEGKSTAASLLAASSAQAGWRTVLVDCDSHQSDVRYGLADYLRGSARLEEIVKGSDVTRMYVIHAGGSIPVDRLMSERMRDLVASLRARFDYVVLDAPPLLPVVDALALATVADKVILVVEWGKTPRAIVAEALKVLRPEAARVAGIVLNKVDLSGLRADYLGYRRSLEDRA